MSNTVCNKRNGNKEGLSDTCHKDCMLVKRLALGFNGVMEVTCQLCRQVSTMSFAGSAGARFGLEMARELKLSKQQVSLMMSTAFAGARNAKLKANCITVCLQCPSQLAMVSDFGRRLFAPVALLCILTSSSSSTPVASLRSASEGYAAMTSVSLGTPDSSLANM